MRTWSPAAFDVERTIAALPLVKRKQGQRKRKNERELLNMVTAFDIECSTIYIPLDDSAHSEHAFMYVWQWAFGRNDVVIGRTWEEFLTFAERISAACDSYAKAQGLSEKPLLVGYVHNLAYEWQFLAGVYHFAPEDTFFAKARKPLYCRMFDAVELRCSYKQSNMTLEKFAERMGTTVRKESGFEYDYNKMRYPWTALTEFETRYIIADVVALVEAIENEMQKDGDNLRTIPLTSTGYVRRDCKKSIAHIRNFVIKPMLPTVDVYKQLRKAFRGGNTHANMRYVGQILENVESVDMVSCYPAQQLTKPFPMTPFKFLDAGADMKRVMRFIARGYAVVALWRFWDLEVKPCGEPCPYISLAKTDSVDFECDNGRILKARYSEMTITEVDLQVILDTYSFSRIAVENVMVAKKAPLPAEYRAVIMQYYQYKTANKLAAENDPDIEYLYHKIKNMLNGIYGMSAQDPIHQRVEFVDGYFQTEKKSQRIARHVDISNDEVREFIESDYNTPEALADLGKAPFPYQWGVYTTAYARQALQEGINRAGDRLVYVDTDSVKTLGHVDFTDINVSRETLAKDNGASAKDEKGNDRPVGVFEVDAVYVEFITQGSKRYAFTKKDKKTGEIKMGITVSGVTQTKNPQTGERYCVEELQVLKNFAPHMRWEKAGGTTAVYNDEDDFDYNTPDGAVRITRNVAIVDTTYEMKHPHDYADMLVRLAAYGDWRRRHE